MESRLLKFLLPVVTVLLLSACSEEPNDAYWGEGKGLGDMNVPDMETCKSRVKATIKEHGYKYTVLIDERDDFLAHLLNKNNGVKTRYSVSCRPNSQGAYTGFVDIPPY